MRISPALVPVPASFWGLGIPFFTRYSRTEMKSFHVLGLVVLKPALYQASPLFATAPGMCDGGAPRPWSATELKILKLGEWH